MPYPASIYNIVTALEDSNGPLTMDEIIEKGEIIPDSVNRAKVKAILTKLVNANLAGQSVPGVREAFTITSDHTGVELKTPDVLEGRIYHENVCTQLAVMTEFNDHLGAYIFGTAYLGSLGLPVENLLKKLQLLSELVELEGQLAPGLSDYQYSLYTQMKTIAETLLNKESFESFYDCF